MAACRAVLDTYELRENIICSLPPWSIFRTRLVSRAWRNIIKTSKAIRTAWTLVPIKQNLFDGNANTDAPTAPAYVRGSCIRVHPTLPTELQFIKCHLETSIPMGPSRCTRLKAHADKFITTPPCQAIGLELEDTKCVVYVREGVRNRDMLEVTWAILQQRLRGPDDRIGGFSALWKFGEMKNEVKQVRLRWDEDLTWKLEALKLSP